MERHGFVYLKKTHTHNDNPQRLLALCMFYVSGGLSLLIE